MFKINFIFNKPERALVLGLAAILLSLILQSVYFAHYITASTTDFINVFKENINSMSHLSLAGRDISDLRLQLSSYPLLTIEQRKQLLEERVKTKKNLDKSLADFEEYLKICEEKELRQKELIQFKLEFQKYWSTQVYFFELVDQDKIEEAARYRVEVTNPAAQAAANIISRIIMEEFEHSEVEERELMENAKSEAFRVWGTVVFSIIVCFIVVFLLIDRFGKLNHELKKAEIVHQNRMNVLAITAANIGHEIKNPLFVIKSRIEMSLAKIKNKSTDYEKIEKDLSQSISYTDRIVKIVNGLKTLSHRDDNSSMEIESFELIMNETIDLADQKVKHHFVDLRVESAVPDLTLRCHPVQLSQVILNLINNSCDAINDQEDKWIEVRYLIVDDIKNVTQKNLVIQITDSGNGISKEIATKIMQPFFTTKKRGEGTGIGLAISLEIIKDHGGELRVDSECKNTRFEILLPIHSFNSNQDTSNSMAS
jgi:signal transduction histidine kinase